MIFLWKETSFNCTLGNHAFKKKRLTKFFTVVSENKKLFEVFFYILLLVHTNEVIVYRVMMYANPLLIV